jgi:sulfatase modifying factor 1
MGSAEGDDDERLAREVNLGAFYMARHEVTNAEYERFSPGHRLKWKEFSAGDDMPVIAVTWEEADAFCRWLSQEEGVEYRLPTEAEWEKAARGTDDRRYPWGDEAPRIGRAKWRCNLAPEKARDTWGNDGFELVAPVGSFPDGASIYGCHDMAGNVWEWCLDWYSPTYYARGPSADPTGPPHGTTRVLRGGSFTNQPAALRSSNRLSKPVDFYEANLGFRCVRVIGGRHRSH